MNRKFFILMILLNLALVLTGWSRVLLAAEKSATVSGAAKVVSPSSQPTDTDRIQKIKSLKERVATRVAELKQADKTIIGGTIKETDNTNWTIVAGNKTVTLYLDEQTEIASISGAKRLVIKQGSVRVGDEIAARVTAGRKDLTYDAKLILVGREQGSYYVGKVSTVDTETGVFSLVSRAETVGIDVELATKINRYSPDTQKIAKSGLSKIRVGDVAFVWGSPLEKNTTKVTGFRVLLFSSATLTPTLVPANSPTIKPRVQANPSPTIEP